MNRDLAQRAAKQLREVMFDGTFEHCVGCSLKIVLWGCPPKDFQHESHCEYIKLVKELEEISK